MLIVLTLEPSLERCCDPKANQLRQIGFEPITPHLRREPVRGGARNTFTPEVIVDHVDPLLVVRTSDRVDQIYSQTCTSEPPFIIFRASLNTLHYFFQVFFFALRVNSANTGSRKRRYGQVPNSACKGA